MDICCILWYQEDLETVFFLTFPQHNFGSWASKWTPSCLRNLLACQMMCYELRALTALTQHCTRRAHASCAPRRSVINHCSYEFWPSVRHSRRFVPRLCSINFQMNQDLIENESMLICSVASKSSAVSSTRVLLLYGKILSYLLHNSSVFFRTLHMLGKHSRTLRIFHKFYPDVVCLWVAARLQLPPFSKLHYRCLKGFAKEKKKSSNIDDCMLLGEKCSFPINSCQ